MKTIKWETLSGTRITSQVKERITYLDMCSIAIAIKDKVFEGGAYRPYRQQLDYVYYVLAAYTDIQFEDVNEMMDEYETGSLKRVVFGAMDQKQLAQICELADDMIEYERAKSGMDRLGALLTGLLATSMAEANTQSEEAK